MGFGDAARGYEEGGFGVGWGVGRRKLRPV